MKTEQVKKLSPRERFLYWVKERHAIHVKREAGEPKPWTNDEVLQNYFFTNPYREHDKVTRWFRENVREPLRNDPRVLFATVAFRWFNYIPTGEILLNMSHGRPMGGGGPIGMKHYGMLNHNDWSKYKVLKRLGKLRDRGEKVFTGAFMINSPAGEPKLEAIVRRINNFHKDAAHLTDRWEPDCTLQGMHEVLTMYDGMGGFMAYEVVTDLRHTYLLENAEDINTWCHIGPGATRGLRRVLGLEFEKGKNATSPAAVQDAMENMRELREWISKELGPGYPPIEIREIEHSLCELDKYDRALWGDGRLKRTYQGV